MIYEILFVVMLPLLLWLICYLSTGSDEKNLTGLRSYPGSVQKKVREDESVGKLAPKEKSIPVIVISNTVLFTLIFLPVGLFLKYKGILTSFCENMVYFLILGETINLFDFAVIDVLWWRNTERIRFSFLPDKADYQDISEHLYSFLRGIPMYAAVAALVSSSLLLFK